MISKCDTKVNLKHHNHKASLSPILFSSISISSCFCHGDDELVKKVKRCSTHTIIMYECVLFALTFSNMSVNNMNPAGRDIQIRL